ncbi:MAG: hypothetical protein KOO60_03775 [Gemmatimonadales bacterium]|nr:hypothetical protein [Gemmatimonadales bacterium]
MSKIFDAYRKSVENNLADRVDVVPDLAREISRAGSLQLFPYLLGNQAEEFRLLANRLLNMRIGQRGVVLAFASTSSGEGASFVSYNAASALANVYHQKVVWLDGNFLSPQQKLKTSQQVSFSSLLQDPPQAASLPKDQSPLLLPGGNNLIGARGLFADEQYPKLLGILASQFDFVIIDSPPVLNSTDTALMVAETDGLLLVIEQKHLKYEVIQHGIQSLEEKGGKVMGTIINRRQFDLPKMIYDRL